MMHSKSVRLVVGDVLGDVLADFRKGDIWHGCGAFLF